MSLSPYLLKVIIDAVVQFSHNQTKLVAAIDFQKNIRKNLSD
jgi:hypothetical protein